MIAGRLFVISIPAVLNIFQPITGKIKGNIKQVGGEDSPAMGTILRNVFKQQSIIISIATT